MQIRLTSTRETLQSSASIALRRRSSVHDIGVATSRCTGHEPDWQSWFVLSSPTPPRIQPSDSCSQGWRTVASQNVPGFPNMRTLISASLTSPPQQLRGNPISPIKDAYYTSVMMEVSDRVRLACDTHYSRCGRTAKNSGKDGL